MIDTATHMGFALSGLALLLGIAAGAFIGARWQARASAAELAAALSEERELSAARANEQQLAQQACQLRLEQAQTALATARETLVQWQQKCESLQAQLLSDRSQLASARTSALQVPTLNEELERTRAQLSESQQALAALTSKSDQEREHFAAQMTLLQTARTELSREFELLAARIFEAKQAQFSEKSKSLLDGTLDPLKQQLQDFRKKVEDVYEKENAERNRLAGQVQELQKQAQKMGDDAINLARALKGNHKAQGNWGEVILARVLEDSGLRAGFEYTAQMQTKAADGRRAIPDVVVHLPEHKDIVIDAKCSLEAYERYCNCADEAEAQTHLKAHVQSLRQHLKGLSEKDYAGLAGLRSLDFVFIFIPIEAAFTAALQAAPELYQEAYAQRIIFVSPTTLLATLRTVENIWRYEKQNKNAQKIAQEAGALHDQLVLVVESLEEVERLSLRTHDASVKMRERLFGGRGNLVKRVDDLRVLGAKTKRSLNALQRDAAGISQTDAEDAIERERDADVDVEQNAVRANDMARDLSD